ncbi:MAG: molybdopterin converting factor subunit 1 [Rhodothermales bacterium]|jgi:molybdopterin converting factor subunit 1
MQIHIAYFAILREQAGVSEETRETDAQTPAALFAEIANAHHLHAPKESLRVAVNESFAEWDRPLQDGDTVAFLPPVAGG